jgi:hypothetical protein
MNLAQLMKLYADDLTAREKNQQIRKRGFAPLGTTLKDWLGRPFKCKADVRKLTFQNARPNSC